MFWVKKAAAATISLFTVFAFGVGIGLSSRQLSPAIGGDDKIVAAQPAGNADALVIDVDAEIARLEKMITETVDSLRETRGNVERTAQRLKVAFEAGLDPKEIKKDRDDLTQFQHEAVTLAAKQDKQKSDLEVLRVLKAQKTKLTQAALDPKQISQDIEKAMRVLDLEKALKALKDKLENQEVQVEGKISEIVLGDLLNLLSKSYGITFVIMEDYFKAEKIPDIKNVKLKLTPTKLNGLKLGAFLDQVLGTVDATYIVRLDYVEITTPQQRLKEKVLRVYPVADLLVGAADNDLEKLTFQLAEAQEQLRQSAAQSQESLAQLRRAEAIFDRWKREVQRLNEDILKMTALKEAQGKGGAGGKGLTTDKPTGAYLQLRFSGKGSQWPYMVEEFGPNGKAIGTIAFENAEVFGRYLTRTMKDSAGPKELRIITQADTPAERLVQALEVCKEVGWKDVVAIQKDNNARTAELLAKYYAVLRANRLAHDELEEAKKQEDLRRLLDKKRSDAEQQEHLMREYQKLVDVKEQEHLKLQDMNRVFQPGNPVILQQERIVRGLEDSIKLKEEELRKLREQNKQEKPR